jgi:hypothetical protein
MQGVAWGDLLDLDQQHLAVAHDETADGIALLGNLAKARRRNAPGRSPHLNDGARGRTPRPESGEGAHCPFEADRRRLDGIALARHGQKRDDALAGKRSMRLSLLLQDRALLQHDVLEMRHEQCEIFRRERSQKQITPARARAIQFHPRPFPSSAR